MNVYQLSRKTTGGIQHVFVIAYDADDAYRIAVNDDRSWSDSEPVRVPDVKMEKCMRFEFESAVCEACGK